MNIRKLTYSSLAFQNVCKRLQLSGFRVYAEFGGWKIFKKGDTFVEVHILRNKYGRI